MKYLTLVVPCYNSEEYLNHCLDTLIVGGDDVEIIVVNDGSKDRTLEIAKEYQTQYPNIIKIIDKENGGHGSGINCGIKEAKGLFFKVCDSDDWFDQDSYLKLLKTIKYNVDNKINVDIYFTDVMYENKVKNTQFLLNNKHHFPHDRVFSWDEMHDFKTGEYIMMHSLTYSLEILKRSGVVLPEKTFYVDNIMAYTPLFYAKDLYYLDVPLYRYFIGRKDQSVNADNMAKRYDQQLRVMDIIYNQFTYDDLLTLPKKQRKYLIHILGIYTFLTMFFIYAKYNKERKIAFKKLREDFKTKNRKLYKKVYHFSQVSLIMCLISPLRRFLVVTGYKVVIKITKWG